MEWKTKKTDKINKIYDKVEQNRQKYQELMTGENAIENAIKFNAKLNERLEKLGVKTCTYIPKEDNDGQN